MEKGHWSDELVRLGACREALEFARKFPDAQSAWDACERGDWMLWWYGRVAGPPGDDSRRPLVLAACACVRLRPKNTSGRVRDQAQQTIETAERWARGGKGAPSLDEVFAAADAAYGAAAAYAAYGAVYVAAVAADADVVRKHYPEPPETGR